MINKKNKARGSITPSYTSGLVLVQHPRSIPARVTITLLSRSVTRLLTAIFSTQVQYAPYIMRLLSAAAVVAILPVKTRPDGGIGRPDA